MTTIADRLRDLRQRSGLTQEEAARGSGLAHNTYVRYETGVRSPNAEAIFILSDFFHCSPSWLFRGYDGSEPQDPPARDPQTKRIPVLGSVAAGQPIFDREFPDVFEQGPVSADFALRVKGDSMEPEFRSGDVVFIRRMQDLPRNGSVCVVAVDDEAALKIVYRDPDEITLASINPEHKPMVYKFSEHSVQILGVPVGYVRILR